MPKRRRTRNNAITPAAMRIQLWERTVTPASEKSMPAVATSIVSAIDAAKSQSRIEFDVLEESMKRRQFLLSAFAVGVGQSIHASGFGAMAFGRQAPPQPAAPPVTKFDEL